MAGVETGGRGTVPSGLAEGVPAAAESVEDEAESASFELESAEAESGEAVAAGGAAPAGKPAGVELPRELESVAGAELLEPASDGAEEAESDVTGV